MPYYGYLSQFERRRLKTDLKQGFPITSGYIGEFKTTPINKPAPEMQMKRVNLDQFTNPLPKKRYRTAMCIKGKPFQMLDG